MEFSKEISVNGVPTVLHFEQDEDDDTFLVTSEGTGDRSYAFTMKMDETGTSWKAQPDIPGLTTHEALQLNNAINDQLDKADEEAKRAEGLSPWNILGS